MKNVILPIICILSFLILDGVVVSVKKTPKREISEMRVIYISYLEYQSNFLGNSKTINETKIDKMIDNVNELNFNCILLHVSPFSDAIYKSKYFPYTSTLTGSEGKYPGFDYLEYFIKKAHQKDIEVHAWINPYRISSNSDTSKLDENNPAYSLLETSHVLVNKSGIYYNPSSEIVKNLIINQVKEIIDNYEVDGIHFDDYFYIQNDIDNNEYKNYINNGGNMSLKEFRLYHTNDLIKRVHKVIKDLDNNIIFSISPDGNINNNYNYHYADIKTWISSNEYIDIIMPQIYYGFDNQYKPFIETFDEWQSLITNENVKLVPILAFYKTGNIDDNAGFGKHEWEKSSDIIKRQIEYIRSKNAYGIGLFRYDFLFNGNYLNKISKNELINVKSIM